MYPSRSHFIKTVWFSLKLVLTLGLVATQAHCQSTSCERNSDCAERGFQDAICTPGKFCGTVVSQTDCPTLLGGSLSGRTTLFALMTKLTGQTSSLGESATKAADLALAELRQYGTGIQLPEGRQPEDLRVLVCNDGSDSDDAVRIARYLTRDLGLPAILGPVYSDPAVAVAKNVTIPNEALMLNPFAVTPLLTPLNDNGLVWRTALSNAPEGNGMWQFVEMLANDPRVKAAMGTEPLRVATVARPGIYGGGIVNDFNEARAKSSLVAKIDSYTLKQEGTNYTFDALPLANSEPHIVVLAGTGEMIGTVVKPLEAKKRDKFPIYVASEGLRLADTLKLIAEHTNAESLRSRLFVFAPSVNNEYYATLASRWEAKYASKLPDLYGVANTYDAIYLLAYALATSGNAAVSGQELALGLRRLTPVGNMGTKRIPAGPKGVADGYGILISGGSINYDGVVGPLDFDPRTGEAPGTYDIFCIHPAATSFVASAAKLMTDTSPPKLTGSYQPCP